MPKALQNSLNIKNSNQNTIISVGSDVVRAAAASQGSVGSNISYDSGGSQGVVLGRMKYDFRATTGQDGNMDNEDI